jgi:hypothetical protein
MEGRMKDERNGVDYNFGSLAQAVKNAVRDLSEIAAYRKLPELQAVTAELARNLNTCEERVKEGFKELRRGHNG